jgi:outer membrane protein
MKPTPLIFALMLAYGPAAQAANLGDIYREALANDTQYAAARAAHQAGQEALPQARAARLPSVGLGGNARYNDVRTTVPNGDTQHGNGEISLDAVQPLYNKATRAQVEQAESQIRIADTQLDLANQDLILRTARAYFDVLLAQDSIVFVRAQKAAITEELATAKRNFEVGTATIIDTQEAQARYDLTVAQEIADDNTLNIRLRALEQIIGKPPGTLDVLAEKASLPAPEALGIDQWAERAEADNLNVAVQRYNVAIADQEVERNRAGHYPTLDAVAGYRYNKNQSIGVSLVDITTATLGVQFNLPLYQGGLTSSRVRQAVANQEKARQDLNTALRAATLQARQAFLNVTSTEAQVRALERAVASTQVQEESTRLGVQVGVRTSLDVLNAQQQVYSEQRRLSAARYQLILAGLELKAAIGKLNVDDLTAVDQALRPSTALQ